MASLAEHFGKNSYKPTYHIGDRVSGHYEGIPYIGTVNIDGRVYVDAPPRIVITLDLPIKVEGKFTSYITTTHENVKLLKNYDK